MRVMEVKEECTCKDVAKEIKFLEIFGDNRLVCEDCFRKFG